VLKAQNKNEDVSKIKKLFSELNIQSEQTKYKLKSCRNSKERNFVPKFNPDQKIILEHFQIRIDKTIKKRFVMN
jgi:hypothetical protein